MLISHDLYIFLFNVFYLRIVFIITILNYYTSDTYLKSYNLDENTCGYNLEYDTNLKIFPYTFRRQAKTYS